MVISDVIPDPRAQRLWLRIYVASSTALLVLLAFHTRNAQWSGDFWEHAAVVRELRAHLCAPEHPQLLMDAPHAFYSPYAWGVAAVARVTGMSPMTGLALAGLFNVAILLLFLHRFVVAFTGSHRAAVIMLVFTLLLWGPSTWGFSGFFHLGMLSYGMPYPSTFAMALTLCALWATLCYQARHRWWWMLVVGACALLVLLSHPLSLAFLVIGVGSLCLGAPQITLKELCGPAFAIGAAGLLALGWPLFSLAELVLGGDSSEFHEGNMLMYNRVWLRAGPSLLAIPILILRLRTNRRDPLVLMFLGLSCVYAFGFVSEKWSYGRVVSNLVFVLHLAMAEWAAARAEAWRQDPVAPRLLRAATPLGLCAVLLVFSPRVIHVARRSLPGVPSSTAAFDALREHIGPRDVVLADMETSFVVPAFYGRAVAVTHGLAFVPDHGNRMRQVEHFFSEEATPFERAEILDRYDVKIILFDRGWVPHWETIVNEGLPGYTQRYSDEKFVLLSAE